MKISSIKQIKSITKKQIRERARRWRFERVVGVCNEDEQKSMKLNKQNMIGDFLI